ncbi:hypothetical protein A2707_04450 [Candidatus Saccharibacteria bacterium RIFCSPHIGHO2_01_FULL_45_15]|nr:MAG: hypothetical protein A2707_04450 [Candidatus Saccharibacteria bacterium RIFCSPHIGHO2_01_FULL_45_15]OGL27186.1 MAG: hypothetical protein A3C39_01335 [Candidatus Saccharibacteria bacterium RIFCSPHIGHO2_02_FULL_46_12]OGL32772.1 MAG: hypothetical protein A3E76_05515 [Candidatus Saccharibacteria bacterium RIFCSPHIGHO2_12_FULL_44_22]
MAIHLFRIKDTRKSVLLVALVSLLLVTSACAAVLLSADNDRRELKQELARILGKNRDEARSLPSEARIDSMTVVRLSRIIRCFDTHSKISDNCAFTSAHINESASAETISGVVYRLESAGYTLQERCTGSMHDLVVSGCNIQAESPDGFFVSFPVAESTRCGLSFESTGAYDSELVSDSDMTSSLVIVLSRRGTPEPFIHC